MEPVPVGDRSLFRSGDAFFERHARGGSRSLFRPYRFQFGPHYQPPPVTYQLPPVIYEPPLEREHSRSRCAPRSRAWYESCAARFRSFDPNTGTYTTYAGQVRVCRCP